jgi:hypothetical protein
MADVIGFFKKIAPFLAKGLELGGPVGAMAGAVINTVAGTKVANADDLAAAFAKTPDQQKFISDLKASEQQFQLQLKQLEINSVEDLEKIMADDRASARAREMTVRDKVPMILAFGVTAGFFSVLFFVFAHGVRPESKEMADIMIGSLGTAWTAIVTYYFGSSHGSDRKTELLASAGKGTNG